MPKHNVTQAFHYAKGGEVLRIKKGEQELSPDVLAHAIKNGFVKENKATQQTAEAEAEPTKAEPKAKR